MIGRLSFVLVLALVGGCSHDSLDRQSAAKAINQRFADNKKEIFFDVGRVGSHCKVVDLPGLSKPFESDQDPGRDVSAVVAVEAGYVTAVPDGKDYWKVTLTQKGQALLDQQPNRSSAIERAKGCEFRQVRFPVATASVVDVSGVTTGDIERQVDFTWKWVPTDLGAALRENGAIYGKLSPEQRDRLQGAVNAGTDDPKISIPIPEDKLTRSTTNFKHYDDGWRLQ